MQTQLTPAYRSEAFAEDLVGLVSNTPPLQARAERRRLSLLNWLPLGVALLGVAFALVPPLV